MRQQRPFASRCGLTDAASSGIERDSDIQFGLKPLFHALMFRCERVDQFAFWDLFTRFPWSFSSCFDSIVLRDVARREAIEELATTLRVNSFISRVVMSVRVFVLRMQLGVGDLI